MAKIFGTAADDTLTGTQQPDRIYGQAGNDTISGLLGDDSLYGQQGNDTLNGNNGKDRLYGGNGNDNLSGNAGSDYLFGGDGNDYLNGEDGKDRLYGGDGNDSIIASGNHIYGGNGDDYIVSNNDARAFGGNGNDTLNGDRGNDHFYGGNGKDLLIGNFGNDTLNGGSGDDTLNGAGPTSVNFPISRGFNEIDVLTAGAGSDTFILRGGSRVGYGPYYIAAGNDDYALITDFNQRQDVIVLEDTESPDFDLFPDQSVLVTYSLGASPDGLPQGTGLFAEFANKPDASPELVAILQNVSPDSLSLTEPYFNIT